MDTTLSFKHVTTLVFFSTLLLLGNAQNTTLASCLIDAGVSGITSADTTGNWSILTTAWQLRIKPDPIEIAFPTTQEELAATLACARESSVKISATSAGHSFAAYGFGYDGNLVVNISAFNKIEYNETTQTLKYGAGNRAGPVLTYLWENHGRHFPHVRSGHVGLAGSSIGGGFGSTSRFLGAPMDSLVAVEYMLYNGSVVTAEKGSDLFWAASGAGSSFGVLLSLTTKTWKPVYATATNFTLTIGSVGIEKGVGAILASQEFALNEAPDEFALRWSLGTGFTATGQYYGPPANFTSMIAPLMARLPSNASLVFDETEFWIMEQFVAAGIALENGGTSPGRAFYGQALTTTTDIPLTYDLIFSLFSHVSYAFNRTDMSLSGLLDLWGGVSRSVSDSDTAFQHGKNLWLIRFDTVGKGGIFPADGTTYGKGLMEPFERDLVDAGITLRGFANYRDTELTEQQWSSRLYGENYRRLVAIKKVNDPEGYFTSNAQSIPVNGYFETS